MAPSITEIIYALGQQNRLKGVTLFSDYPEAAKKQYDGQKPGFHDFFDTRLE
jgi:ABC-type hemin transport system substrate-binding protein